MLETAINRLAMVDFSEQRLHMIKNQLMPCGVSDPFLLKILAQVHRENFLPDAIKPLAYQDETICLDSNRYMLRPNTLMRMILGLQIQAGDHVLDAGCLTGYSAILLSFLATHVTALEKDKTYIEIAKKMASMEGTSNIEFKNITPEEILASEKTYDAILVQEAHAVLPPYYSQLLKDQGRIVYIRQNAENYGQVICGQKNYGELSEKALFEISAPYMPQPPASEFIF